MKNFRSAQAVNPAPLSRSCNLLLTGSSGKAALALS
jgi:hypothetical protein